MQKNDLEFIQKQIGYKFKNPQLLVQAFTRRSYSQENGGNDNEVLEFIGDKVLDIAVVKLLTEKYGSIDKNNEFFSDYQENKLTEIKSSLVQKKTLAERTEKLGLSKYLREGKGDIQSNINSEDSVKEDLFEAILGAVAIDCDWNFNELINVAKTMLSFEELMNSDCLVKNYIQLIQDWSLKKSNKMPNYSYEEKDFQTASQEAFSGMTKNPSTPDEMEKYREYHYVAILNLNNVFLPFRAFGKSKSDARKNVCEYAYQHLKGNNILLSITDEIKNPNIDEAINQLETLSRRGYFPLPTYDYEKQNDSYGNPIWKCKCTIGELSIINKNCFPSKKQAKKDCAYTVLKIVLNKKEIL